MERNGMRREALHRKAFWARVDKEWIDEAWYAILAEEYRLKTSQTQEYEIRQVGATLLKRILPIIEISWGSTLIAVNGKLWDSQTMPGFVAVSGDGILGYLLYEFHDGECEIMVLESVVQNIGIGSALIEKVKHIAKSSGVSSVIVQTSNDNTHACSSLSSTSRIHDTGGTVRYYGHRKTVEAIYSAHRRGRDTAPRRD